MPRRPRLPSGWESSRGVPVVVVILLIGLISWLFGPGSVRRPAEPAPAPSREGYLFCSWNVENLFDDQDDPKSHDEDEDWLGRNPDVVRRKVALLADALLLQNEGRGPDILALIEVENRRAVELLRDALNARLATEWQYTGLVHDDNRTGRRIEPAVLTRLPVRDDRTRGGHDFANRRILEAHLEAGGAPLVLLVSHWTSRVTDQTDVKRSAYADAVYQAVLEHTRADPAADVLIAGDFNDEPDDPSLRDHLHATGDAARVRAGDLRPMLLDLLADKDPDRDGTYFYNGRWEILDHIVASPGLLDPSGWLVLPETTRTEHPIALSAGRDGRPQRFGNARNQNPRGPSDHFAVSVRLRVAPPQLARGGPGQRR